MRIIVGDLWEEQGWKVVPVNLRGVMGRGVAKQASDLWPGPTPLPTLHQQQTMHGYGYFSAYEYHAQDGPASRLLLLAVKDHWRDQADLGIIATGLTELRRWYVADYPQIKPRVPIFLPLLGCGFGEGDPLAILPLLARYLDSDDYTLVVADSAVGRKYQESLRPAANRSDRRWPAG